MEFETLSTFSMSSAALNFEETLLTGKHPVWALAKGTADTAVLGFGWMFLVPSERAGSGKQDGIHLNVHLCVGTL